MELRAEEISKILKEQIANYETRVEVAETGTILSVGDGIALLCTRRCCYRTPHCYNSNIPIFFVQQSTCP